MSCFDYFHGAPATASKTFPLNLVGFGFMVGETRHVFEEELHSSAWREALVPV